MWKRWRKFPATLPAVDGERYSAKEAARILGLSDRRVKQLLEEGRIKGTKTPEGRWLVDARSLNAFREEREPFARPRRGPDESDLIDRLQALAEETGRLRGMLELTERAESTLQEQLDRERERADQAELEARRLRAALEEARKPERPWWRRVFGS